MKFPKLHAIIPAAGNGSRMCSEYPKQFKILAGKPMVLHAISIFLQTEKISRIHLGLHSDKKNIITWPNSHRLYLHSTGGSTRQETVLNTILQIMKNNLAQPDDWILIHDAARPGISVKLVTSLIEQVLSCQKIAGGILALPVTDTLKKSIFSHSLFYSNKTMKRSNTWLAQTPQMFRLWQLKKILTQCIVDNIELTDEASAFERKGFRPLLVKGSITNFKVTYPDEWILMQNLLMRRFEGIINE